MTSLDNEQKQSSADRWTLWVVAVTTLLSIGVSIVCLLSGSYIVFQNLFYVPIIIACVSYSRGGLIFSIVLACFYFLLILVFTHDPSILLQALIRVAVFILVAGVVAHLSSVRTQAEKSLRKERDHLEELVLDRTASLEEELKASKWVEGALQRSVKEALRLTKENEIAADIGQLITSTIDIGEIYKEFSEKVREHIPFDRVVINLIDLERSSFSVAYHEGIFVSGRQRGDVGPLEGTVTKQLLMTGKGFIVQLESAIEIEKEYPGLLPEFQHGIRSFLTVPLISKDHVIGGLALRSTKSGAYTDRDLRLAGNIANQIAGATSNAQLFIERKRVEEALRESEGLLRGLYENMTSGAAIYKVINDGSKGSDYIIRDFNAASLRIEGKRKDEVVGKSLFDLRPDIDHYGLIPIFQKVWRTGEPGYFPSTIYIDEKYSNWYENWVFKLPTGEIVAIYNDVTERKQVEEERRKLEAKLQRSQKMEALGLMAGGVAHDVNNMLSAIITLPELILRDIPEEDQKLRRRMQMIMSSGERIAAVVNDLLTVTRGVTMAQDVQNLNKVVQEYIRSPEFEKLRQFHPNVEVVTELADDLLAIKGSRVHLMKTLMNLVSNAAEAFRLSDSGVVSVSTENRYVDTPLQGYERVNIGEYAVLVVRDNGIGISPEDMERIFEPFYTKKVMGRSGTGLGLSVVWNTVTGHDGYIHIESGGGGTVFELYFPITRESVSEQKKPLDLKQYKGRGEKVLVVDDESDQRVIAVDILGELGYQAEAVSGGQEALEFLKEHEVDILLLDMVMPGMDGWDTFRRIVQLKPGQKAVIASGFSMDDRVKKAQELGAGAYIRKPYSIEKLGMAIKTELDK